MTRSSTSSGLEVEYVAVVACAGVTAPVSITTTAPATTSTRFITAPLHELDRHARGHDREQRAFQSRKSLRVGVLRHATSQGGQADVNIVDGRRRARDVSNFLTLRRQAAETGRPYEELHRESVQEAQAFWASYDGDYSLASILRSRYTRMASRSTLETLGSGS